MTDAGHTPKEPDVPPARYIAAEQVITFMAQRGRRRLDELDALRVLTLAVIAGGLITVGALFSLVVAAEVDAAGPARVLEGTAFSAGFLFVILSETVLFTEANVVLPATLTGMRRQPSRVARFWALAWVGNFAGTLAIGALVAAAQDYPRDVLDSLDHVIDLKLQYEAAGGVDDWFRVVGSGVLANWMVGMAAFFAVMGRTIFGKFVPLALAVTLFVAANFQHSPANMAYFSLQSFMADGPGWATALWWNIVPAGLGNIAGGALLVALPFHYAFQHAAAEPR